MSGRLTIRIPGGPDLGPQAETLRQVTFSFDGQPVVGLEGEPVAMSLWALGYRSLGWNEESGRPRGLYCAIGHCFECRMTIDGQRDQRACCYPVREGLAVSRQSKPVDLEMQDGMDQV